MAEIEDIRSIKNHLNQDELKHVYLFYGPENYLKDLYTQRIRNRLDCDPMNCYFYGPEVDPKELEAICSSVSMFGDQKLIIISGSGFFQSAGDPSFLEKAEAGGTYLIFKEEEVDKRNKFYKKVCDCGIAFHCKNRPPEK